ncbi:hypothetical protein Veis_2846 [Verminephrobacter eiseniae EF01-2]|uniref:Uncharacterized protein n=1 Tax=Verminephrobacter eiseniae (strain EF01-2) TaxID=391735 RepID=A1WLS6_VEREI|nr:hypothetical protein Veis_2846 [Verminephrobacter eiseniae EF01-2]
MHQATIQGHLVEMIDHPQGSLDLIGAFQNEVWRHFREQCLQYTVRLLGGGCKKSAFQGRDHIPGAYELAVGRVHVGGDQGCGRHGVKTELLL